LPPARWPPPLCHSSSGGSGVSPVLLASRIMEQRFGDRATFAVEVGDVWPPPSQAESGNSQTSNLRVVDLWAGGRQLTVDDNTAFLPSFCPAMRRTADEVRRRQLQRCPFPGRSPEEIFRLLEEDDTEFRERFWFMLWGETLDNVTRYAYLDGDLVLVFAFWRSTHPRSDELGRVFVARVPPDDFVTTVECALAVLDPS
jgi:hypothetical protein